MFSVVPLTEQHAFTTDVLSDVRLPAQVLCLLQTQATQKEELSHRVFDVDEQHVLDVERADVAVDLHRAER